MFFYNNPQMKFKNGNFEIDKYKYLYKLTK